MAKSKNHTNHNQNRKNHKNGIKKPKHLGKSSTKGMCPRFIKNMRFARKGDRKAKMQKQNQQHQVPT